MFSIYRRNSIGDTPYDERNAIASVLYNLLSNSQPTFNAVAHSGRFNSVSVRGETQKFEGSDVASGAYRNLRERTANDSGGDCNDLRASVDAIRRMVNNNGPFMTSTDSEEAELLSATVRPSAAVDSGMVEKPIRVVVRGETC